MEKKTYFKPTSRVHYFTPGIAILAGSEISIVPGEPEGSKSTGGGIDWNLFDESEEEE